MISSVKNGSLTLYRKANISNFFIISDIFASKLISYICTIVRL